MTNILLSIGLVAVFILISAVFVAAEMALVSLRESQIKQLTSELGFKYKYVEEDKQYAHSAASFVLTPEGKISRVIYGISFPERDLKLALLEASNGKIGTIVDRLLLFCFHYDPHTRKYSIYVMRMMQSGAAGTVIAFGAFMAVFWRRERRKFKEKSKSERGA